MSTQTPSGLTCDAPHRRLLHAGATELCDWLVAHHGNNWALRIAQLPERDRPEGRRVVCARNAYRRMRRGGRATTTSEVFDALWLCAIALGFVPGDHSPTLREVPITQ